MGGTKMVKVTKSEFYDRVGPMEHTTSRVTGGYPYGREIRDSYGRLVARSQDHPDGPTEYFVREA